MKAKQPTLGALLRDPERTEQAFEVMAALDPELMERGLARMLSHPVGRRLFMERPCLLERLSDREALARLPEGSFGRAYLAHVECHDLDPGKLVDKAVSYWGGVRLTDHTRKALLDYATKTMAAAIADEGRQRAFPIMTYNALRHLVAISPEMQTA